MRWWNREFTRQGLALPLAFLGLLVPGNPLVKFLGSWDIYATGYLLLTWLTFRGHGPAELKKVVLASQRRLRGDRWYASTPEQVAQGAAVVALLATVAALPQAQTLGGPTTLVLAICVGAIVTSWLALHTGFLITYLGLYAENGGVEFPGDAEPGLVDFAYFTASVGTTFGTTDVTVTQSRVRRRVIAHGVLSFLFNTLILAVAVTLLTSYIADK